MARASFVAAMVALVVAACGDDATTTPPICEPDPTLVTCPPPVTMRCSGPSTPVSLGAPEVDASCDVMGGAFSDDAPSGGFPIGATTVTFVGSATDGASLSCTTTVTVTDTAPPAITCPADFTVVRTAPDEVLAAPEGAVATDDCASAPTITAAPAPEAWTRGDNDVVSTATDLAGLTDTCTTRVTVLDAFAPELVRLISAEIAPDGTTDVTLAWDPAPGDDVSGYAIERAAASDGPWAVLSEVAPTVRTFTDDTLADDQAFYRVRSMAGTFEGGASTPVHAYAIEATGYDRRGETVATVPFATTLYGVVRHPRDLAAGPYPLVLMLHGNHGICRRTITSDTDVCADSRDHECPLSGYVTTPNAEGLAYLAETVAAQGYVAVTISGNAVNCRDGWILERAQLILAHLRRWEEWQRTSAPPFGRQFVGAVDTTRTALFGHSRGGEAVAHVPGLLSAAPIAGVSLASVFSLAPTDYDMPTPDLPYAVVLPGCDGDVSTNVGTDIFDRSIRLTDEHPRSQVHFVGANHNFFSTEWRVDDSTGTECRSAWEIGGPAQRGMLEGVVGAWLAGTVGGGVLERFLRGDADTPEGIDAWADHDLDLRWSHVARRARIDEFEGMGTPDVNLLGEANGYSEFETAGQCYDNGCMGRYPHEKGALRLRWDGMTPIARIGLGGLDATGYGYFAFRVVSRRSTFNDAVSEQIFRVRLSDSAGTTAVVRTDEVTRIPHLYPHNNPLEIFQSVRVPLTAFEAATPGFDPGALEAAELEFTEPGHTRGSVLVSDVSVGD